MPPPPPPPPSAKDFKPPPKTKGRGDMLKSIEGFKKGKLKKTETVDKSVPAVSGVKTSAGSSAPSASGGSGGSSASYSSPAASLSGMGGIFAGGVPRLRKTGLPGSSTMLPGTEKSETPAAAPVQQNNQPRAAIPPITPPVTQPTPKVTSPRKKEKMKSPRKKKSPRGSGSHTAVSPRRNTVSGVPSHGPTETGLTLVVAVYPFDAQRKTDLSLLPDDIVRVTNKSPPGSGNGKWWEGVSLSGASGHFPSNYVKELSVCQQMKVAHDYSAERGDELSLKAGKSLNLYLRRESGWWLGAIGEKYGLFPSNFVL
uniref:SH3 domain-containing protein n=1 Tax=Vannella robusta TaxID=1487602 RepID=A0A7S4I8N2_9EUKA